MHGHTTRRDSSYPTLSFANAAIYFTDAAKTTGYGTQPFGTFTTSSLVFNGVNDGVCGNYDYICYAWKNIPGVQKFGEYIANGSADGNFLELGFRPALLWIKATGSYSPGDWFVHDDKRDISNPTAGDLQLNTYAAEGTTGSGYYVDFLSNGFKLRANGNGENGASGNTYIYCAWAHQPYHNLYGAQSNAR